MNLAARQTLSPSESHTRRALTALVTGGLAIGCSPIFVRLSGVGPVATAFWRLALALPPLLFLLRQDSPAAGQRRLLRAWDYCVVSLPGLFLAADLAAWHISLHMTTVANSTLLVNTAPIFVTLISGLFLGQRIRGAFITGLAIAMTGIVVLKGGPDALQGGSLSGDSLAVLAAALYAGYILTVRHARHSYTTGQIMLWSTVSATLCTGLLAASAEQQLMPSTAVGWLILIALSWISQVGGQTLITYALAWLPATLSSLTLLIQPVVASLLAWRLLHEPLSGAQSAGGLIVIAGIMLARRVS